MRDAAPERVEVTCPSCGRAMRLLRAALARRAACAYCGAALTLPDGVAAALPQGPLTVECPVCAKLTRLPRRAAGGAGRCGVCGCPLEIPEADGLAVETPPAEAVPALAPGEALAAACPQCGDLLLQATVPCFRAIFGIWATGAMFQAVHADAVKRRLELLGGTLAAEAEATARALTERQAVSAEDIGERA